MKITTKTEPKAKIKVTSGTSFAYETPEHLPKLHQVCCLYSRRGTFKTTAITNLLRMYMEGNAMERIIWVSNTAGSNKKLLKQLNIDEEDVFDPNEKGVVMKIRDIVEQERDEYVRYKQLRENYKKVMKDIKHGMSPRTPLFDNYLVSYYDVRTNTFRMPEPKYKCYDKRPPIVACVFDDVLGSALLRDKMLLELTQKHRHEGSLPEGGAVGISLYYLVQSFKAVGGLNRSIRNQATTFLVGRTKDEQELKEVAEACAGEVSPEVFMAVYHEATKDSSHHFLFVDLHKKDHHPSMFRKNFDTYLIVEDGVKK